MRENPASHAESHQQYLTFSTLVARAAPMYWPTDAYQAPRVDPWNTPTYGGGG